MVRTSSVSAIGITPLFKRLSRRFQVRSISTLLVLLTALPVIIILTHQSQDLRQHADGESIDTLSFFMTHHPNQVLTGTHTMSQEINGTNIYMVKWSANSFEAYRYDANYIYLVEDHSGAPLSPYSFSNGQWMKRTMQVGESFTMPEDNTIQNFDNSCSQIASPPNVLASGTPYRAIMTLEQHNPAYPAGGDIGNQDVIVLRYDFTGGNFERFYYSHDWGWIRWESYAANQLTQTSIFNKIAAVVPTTPRCAAACTPSMQSCLLAPTPTHAVGATATPVPATITGTPTTTPGVSTATPTTTPRVGTGTPTVSPTPSPTHIPFPNATITLTAFLHGIGTAGDLANPIGIGNDSPVTTSRRFTLEAFKGGTPIATGSALMTYNAVAGNYQGSISLSPPAQTGSYILALKSSSFLKAKTASLISITAGQPVAVSPLSLIAGDAVEDNTLDILDYNAILSCYNTDFPGCTKQLEVTSDLDNNGTVDLHDLNLFLREIGNLPTR